MDDQEKGPTGAGPDRRRLLWFSGRWTLLIRSYQVHIVSFALEYRF